MVLTDVHVAKSHHPGALLKVGGLQHKEEGQVVVSQFQIRLIYVQDLLSEDPEIHQLFTYRSDREAQCCTPNLLFQWLHLGVAADTPSPSSPCYCLKYH